MMELPTPEETRSGSRRASSASKNLENGNDLARHLTNDSVRSFSWQDVNVTVRDRKTRKPLSILTSSHGYVEAGQVLALMGPSGSGKTTALNVLAQRAASSTTSLQGKVMVNGGELSQTSLRQLSSYVEQEDALIGSLTVRETIDFAARLALSHRVPRKERRTRVDDLVDAFGLRRQAHSFVGTPLQKGISGGQKRRVSVASQLVTSPKILFLDEPTSGLDSAASHEVMSYIADIAKEHQIIVVASIHQPSSSTFALFDRIILLSEGKTCFYGTTQAMSAHFERISHPIPIYTNPAEFVLDLVNTDFAKDSEFAHQQLSHIQTSWATSAEHNRLLGLTQPSSSSGSEKSALATLITHRQTPLAPWILLHRNFLKSYRDVLAYHTRIVMYLALSVMTGTIWLRLPYTQSSIQPFINVIFFGGAFMSFMAIAYIPPAIEDLQTFRKERANGLYGPAAFVVSNFLIGLPYLFLITLLFSIVCYWLTNLKNSGEAFWMWVLWLFLDLVAAEGLVMLITSVAPIFVVALSVTAFANGLWMCVSGFFVPLGELNVFWKYVFHYICYQAYVFQGLMVNQFEQTIYSCDRVGTGFQCMYPSDLQDEGKIRGTAVIDAFQFEGKVGEWVGIMISIIVVYRILGWLVLVVKKN